MIDKWFLEDIEQQIKMRKRVVILDPKSECGFLMPLLDKKGYTVIKTNPTLTEEWQTVKEELFIRHTVETTHENANVVFYITRDQDSLSFLFDYCFTHGCVDFSNSSDWLRKKLFANTGTQVQMNSSMLLTAAKLGIGKDIAWWKKILQNLEDLVILEEELLPFLHNPEEYYNAKDADVRRMFEEKLFLLLNQPYIQKPPQTLADEVVKKLFDGLLTNTISGELLQIYYRWVDSDTYRKSLNDYLGIFPVPNLSDFSKAHPDHCFKALDKKAILELTKNLRDKEFVSEKLLFLKKRASSQRVKQFIPTWWQDVIALLEFDSNPLSACNSFIKVVGFYTSKFAKVDRAIRNLYEHFLQEEEIIRPLQEYYESLNKALLDKWFEYFGEYKTDQQGYLVNVFKKAKPDVKGIAVIVGDGVRYEIADQVATVLQKKMIVEKQTMLADMPSETEHNMSALYVGNNKVLPLHKDREKSLTAVTGKEIKYIDLADLSYRENAQFLVLTYKDIDSAGEKMQHSAIRLFSEFESVLQEKITELICTLGYSEVHLITDHGFVLTGLLTESDKIDPSVSGLNKLSERYIRTVDKQVKPDWLMFDRKYDEYKYVYAAKSHRPFKSRGVYGFSHGGFTPQEIVIPKFVFKKQSKSSPVLAVSFLNKKELEEITGNLFNIKIQAGASTDMFASKRKVQVYLYAGNNNYASSSILTIEANATVASEFSFNGHSEVMAVLLDAETQEQLDRVTIKKSNARDLGGLL